MATRIDIPARFILRRLQAGQKEGKGSMTSQFDREQEGLTTPDRCNNYASECGSLLAALESLMETTADYRPKEKYKRLHLDISRKRAKQLLSRHKDDDNPEG